MIKSTIKHRVTSYPDIQNENAHRLFVFAESRSGSTWLINTLNSHPDIGMLDEIINPDYLKTLNASYGENQQPGQVSALQKMENPISPLKGKYKGCKILFPQSIRFIDFYEFILNYRNAFFIILTRNNCIRAEISGLIANEYKRWHLVEKKEKQQISVDPAFLYERLLWRKHSKDFTINMIRSFCNHHMQIEYSELFSNTDETLRHISTFLTVAPGVFRFGTEIKSNPFPLRELITNYDECRSFFIDRLEYLSFFDNDNCLD
jgi:hypothetical protein